MHQQSSCCENDTNQMMRTQNRAILNEVVEIVHDHSNKEVQDKEAAYKDKRGEEEVGEVGAAPRGISLV